MSPHCGSIWTCRPGRQSFVVSKWNSIIDAGSAAREVTGQRPRGGF
jgi:hypothetical protein